MLSHSGTICHKVSFADFACSLFPRHEKADASKSRVSGFPGINTGSCFQVGQCVSTGVVFQ